MEGGSPVKRLVKGLVLSSLLCLLLALSGCGLFKPIEDLYTLPALPEEYSQLQTGISKVMNDMDAEFASILYGNYTSTIQLLDMDGDGEQEIAAVFLRVINTDGVDKPLRICLFRIGADGTYGLTHTIQGAGTYIHSVTYEDMTGDGRSEIIVSWQVSSNVYNLSAYQLTPDGVNELMSTSYNERFIAVDLDSNGCKELVVFQHYTSESERNRAEYYRIQNGRLVMTSSTPLSEELRNISSVRSGRLSDGIMGVYVNAETETGELTDILVLGENGLRNVTMNAEMGSSQTTNRVQLGVSITDINRDGILEIPRPVATMKMNPDAASDHYITYWWQYDSQGVGTVTNATYHSVMDGWYLVLPTEWLGKITVGRDDTRSSRGERAVVFYYWPDQETTTAAPFLTIYCLTGDNRYTRARLSGRVTLSTTNSSIYCVSLNSDVWNCGLDASAVTSRFNLITPEWSTQ